MLIVTHTKSHRTHSRNCHSKNTKKDKGQKNNKSFCSGCNENTTHISQKGVKVPSTIMPIVKG